jgi:glucokinase
MVAVADPEVVILGGGLGEAACAALAYAPEASAWYQCPVRAATLGDDAGVIGAALYALGQVRPAEVPTRSAAPAPSAA